MFVRNAIVWLITLLGGLIAQAFVLAETKICETVDIQFWFEYFEQLRECTLVQGHVKISNFDDSGDHNELAQYTFPELRLIQRKAPLSI